VLRAALDAGSDPVSVAEVVAGEACIRVVNEAFSALTGFAPDEVVGSPSGVLVGPETDLSALGRVDAALRDTGSAIEELTLHTADGSSWRVELRARRLRLGDEVWVVTTYRDLSAARRAAAARWRTEEWAQAIVGGISDVIAVADRDTVLTWVSPSVERRLGYAPDDVLGRSCLELLHPDDLEHAAREWEEVTAHGSQGAPTPYRLFAADGTTRLMNVSATPMFDHVAIDGMILTCSDITEWAAAEAQLRHSELWAQRLVQGGSDLVVVADTGGTVRYASPAVEVLLGLRPEEVVGRAHLELIHPEDLPIVEKAFGELAVAPSSIELRLRHRDGSWRIFDVAFSDLTDDPVVAGVMVNLRDVTERRRAEELLAQQADLLEAIARGAPLEITLQKITQMTEHGLPGARCAIGMVDSDGTIRVRAAPNLPRQIVNVLDGFSPRSAEAVQIGTSAGEFLVYDLVADRRFADLAAFAESGLVQCRVAALHAPGSGELLGAMSVFRDRDDPPAALEQDLLARAMNLSAIAIERRRFEATLEYQALYDGLTGLPNRSLLRTRIDDALGRAGRLGTGVAVLFLDIDRFKVVNDSVGHELGDTLLQLAAERLREPLRPGDTLGRFGGDEFMVVCNRIADEAAAAAAAQRFAAVLADPFALGDGEVFVTASVGIAHGTGPEVGADALIRNADVAMYRAKAQGRNQQVVFTENLDQRKVEQLALEQALRSAIDAEEFELHFQPAVRLADGAMTHVEALVRWHRPDHGMVMPGLFIPLAEETGLIVPLGWWVLERACDAAVSWPSLPVGDGGDQVQVAVNLSARQLASGDLHDVVTRVLQRTGLDPARLCFEITESDLVHDVESAKAALVRLKELGVKIAIDDFGTGYASLDYIRHFTMADFLKIDRSFVDGVEQPGSQEAAIVQAAIALAKSLGLRVVAEGVETPHQMDALRALDCDLAQGFLFSRPVPIDEAIVLLQAQPGLPLP
jgi:diguanylate cyclase (GGDEF)-like protein/PAS domain S-box-containing protein